MVKRCFVFNCRTGQRSNKNNEHKYSLFKAPNDVTLLQKWRNSVPLRERELNSNDRICEKHFEKHFILPRYQQSRCGDYYQDHIRPKLTPDAVPTIFDEGIQLKVYTNKKPHHGNSFMPNISMLLLPHVEVSENDTVHICYKCLLGKCPYHAVFVKE